MSENIIPCFQPNSIGLLTYLLSFPMADYAYYTGSSSNQHYCTCFGLSGLNYRIAHCTGTGNLLINKW